METQILISYNEATIDIWTNALQEQCISFEEGNTTIKILDIPDEVADAINDAKDRA